MKRRLLYADSAHACQRQQWPATVPAEATSAGLDTARQSRVSRGHPQAWDVLQPTRCQDSLPGGVIAVRAGGISAQLVPIAAHAICAVNSSASDCTRDPLGVSHSDRSDSGLSLRAGGARRSAPCAVSTSEEDRSLGNERRAAFASGSCAPLTTGTEPRAAIQTMARSLITVQSRSGKLHFLPWLPCPQCGSLSAVLQFLLLADLRLVLAIATGACGPAEAIG